MANSSALGPDGFPGPDEDADDDTPFNFECRIITAPRWVKPINWSGGDSDSVWDISPNARIVSYNTPDSGSEAGTANPCWFTIDGLTWVLQEEFPGTLQIKLSVFFSVSGGYNAYVRKLGYKLAVVGTLAEIDANALRI